MSEIALSSFLLGLAFGWGPCLASCGPLVLSYSVGTQKNHWQGLVLYLVFSASRIFIYVMLAVLFFFMLLSFLA